MGNRQLVADWYIDIREGEPQPTMAMKVGVGRERREEGVMEAVRERTYSWQFCWRLSVFALAVVVATRIWGES